jgi:hypothetical protein
LAADDLDAPLGRDNATRKKLAMPAFVPKAIAGLLGLAVLFFAGWTLMTDDPFGGEPAAVASIEKIPVKKPAGGQAAADGPRVAGNVSGGPADTPRRSDGPDPAAASTAPQGKTVTIIDGSSGKTQQVVIGGSSEAPRAPVDTRLLDQSRHGAIPRIAPDGSRPSEIYARPVQPGQNPDGPRIAVIIGGLGVGATSTSEALSKMPGAVTLGFMPYGTDLENLAGRARAEGHEVLLQVPMEPFDYPDNDPGPQTLLSSL